MTRQPTGDEIFTGVAGCLREFDSPSEGHHRLRLVELGIEFDVDRLEYNKGELVGELAVHCEIPGARPIAPANFNFSSRNARRDLGKYLADRVPGSTLDWLSLLEEFCERVSRAERTGKPSVSLRELPRPSADDSFDVVGLRLLKQHPVMMFGDGGTAKSYLALYFGGLLASLGVRVGMFDWELSGSDHRERLERLFGRDMPDIRYVRCERPLVYEADRLKRIVETDRLDYAIFDSVAFACDGPPESAECAGKYYRAVRQLGIGSLHVAHITKGENGDQRPFGSTFWHNGARATWFLKLTSPDVLGQDIINVGMYPRKANLGRLGSAIAFEIRFTSDATTVSRVNVAEVEGLSASLPLWQRIEPVLRRKALTIAELAETLDEKVDSVEKALRRKEGKQFIRTDSNTDGITRWGLLKRDAA